MIKSKPIFSLEDEKSDFETASDLKQCNPSESLNREEFLYNNDIIDSNDEWKQYDLSHFMFFAVLTHEARSSLGNEIFLPWNRFNDRKMYIGGYKE